MGGDGTGRGNIFGDVSVGVVEGDGSGERGESGTSSSDRCSASDGVVRVVEVGDDVVAVRILDGGD